MSVVRRATPTESPAPGEAEVWHQSVAEGRARQRQRRGSVRMRVRGGRGRGWRNECGSLVAEEGRDRRDEREYGREKTKEMAAEAEGREK